MTRLEVAIVNANYWWKKKNQHPDNRIYYKIWLEEEDLIESYLNKRLAREHAKSDTLASKGETPVTG